MISQSQKQTGADLDCIACFLLVTGKRGGMKWGSIGSVLIVVVKAIDVL